MAGRHGVPDSDRRDHSRVSQRQRRRRTRRNDALQPWRLWLAVRIVLALIVLGAIAWSAWLLTRHRGEWWPWVAVVAGALSLLLIVVDVLGRRRERRRIRAQLSAAVAAESQHSGIDPAPPMEIPEPLPAGVPEPGPAASRFPGPPMEVEPVPDTAGASVVPAVPPVESAPDAMPVAVSDAVPAAANHAAAPAIQEIDLPPELPEYRGRHSHRK